MESLRQTRERMQQANKQRASAVVTKQHFDATQASQRELRDTIIQSFQMLANYLENRTGKTEVVNQLKEIGTPDALKVVKAIDELHDTLKTHENTDLTGVISLLQKLLKQAEAIPKDKLDITIPDTVTVANQKDYSDNFQALETAVRAIQLVAEAPVVNVPAPNVTVTPAEIDLSPIDKGLKTLEKAVKSITIPEFNTTDIQKLLKKTNILLGEILDKPVGGGGGGGRATPYETVDGVPQFVQLTSDGSVPVVNASLTERYDLADASVLYTATAPRGTADSATGWTITKIDLSDTANASGKVATDVSWNNRATGSYN